MLQESGASSRVGCQTNWPAVTSDDTTRLLWSSDGKFFYKEVQFKKFFSPVKTSCPPDENVNEKIFFVYFLRLKVFTMYHKSTDQRNSLFDWPFTSQSFFAA